MQCSEGCPPRVGIELEMSNAADGCCLIPLWLYATLLSDQQDNWVTAIYSSTHFSRYPPTDSLRGVTWQWWPRLAESRRRDRGRRIKKENAEPFFFERMKNVETSSEDMNSSLNSTRNLEKHLINSSEDTEVGVVDELQVNRLAWPAHSARCSTTVTSSDPDHTPKKTRLSRLRLTKKNEILATNWQQHQILDWLLNLAEFYNFQFSFWPVKNSFKI